MNDLTKDIFDELAQDISDNTQDLIVGEGNFNSTCNALDYGKAVGVMYQKKGDVKIHNGRIIGCDGAGYIVKHCANASNGYPFKFDTFYFYNEKYFNSHKINKSNAYPFINIGIRDTQKAFCYYGRREGANKFDTHNGVFHSFKYINDSKKLVTSSNYDLFLSYRYKPSAVQEIVYYHYVVNYDPKTHKSFLQYEKAKAIKIQHFGEIPFK